MAEYYIFTVNIRGYYIGPSAYNVFKSLQMVIVDIRS